VVVVNVAQLRRSDVGRCEVTVNVAFAIFSHSCVLIEYTVHTRYYCRYDA